MESVTFFRYAYRNLTGSAATPALAVRRNPRYFLNFFRHIRVEVTHAPNQAGQAG